MRKKARAAARAAGRREAGRARPRPRRPSRHRSLYGRAGLLPCRRGRRRRKRRRDRPLLGTLASCRWRRLRWLYPLLLRRWDGGAGEDRRHRRRGRRGRRLPGRPLPRPRARADRALARERPGRPGQRRHLPGRLGAAESRCPRARPASPTRPGTGTTSRRRSRCASWRRWTRRWSAPATSSRCAARTCGRRWNGRPRSTEPAVAAAASRPLP